MEEKPDWRELIQEAVERGDDMDCSGIECEDCIFNPAKEGEECADYFPFTTTEDEERLTLIHRHLLITVRDWNDFDEIRAHLAEMLDDPEKFLGKAEPEWRVCYVEEAVMAGTYSNDGRCGRDDHQFPRLTWFVKSCDSESPSITRAGFLTEADAQLFLDALPEEERDA